MKWKRRLVAEVQQLNDVFKHFEIRSSNNFQLEACCSWHPIYHRQPPSVLNLPVSLPKHRNLTNPILEIPNGFSWSGTFRCFFPWTESAICRNLKIAPSSRNTHAAIGAPKTHFIGSWTRFWQRNVRSSDRCRLDCFLSARFVYNSPLTCSRWIVLKRSLRTKVQFGSTQEHSAFRCARRCSVDAGRLRSNAKAKFGCIKIPAGRNQSSNWVLRLVSCRWLSGCRFHSVELQFEVIRMLSLLSACYRCAYRIRLIDRQLRFLFLITSQCFYHSKRCLCSQIETDYEACKTSLSLWCSSRQLLVGNCAL